MLPRPYMNAIELLKQQHVKVKQTLEKLSEGKGTPGEIQTLANELVAHMVIEEHIFYPRMKEVMEDMIDEAFEEHAVARFELARLLQARGDVSKTRATVLKELIEHHVEEEEKELFPKVTKQVPEEELVRLGVRMKSAFDKAVEKGFASFFQPAEPARTRAVSNGHAAQAR